MVFYGYDFYFYFKVQEIHDHDHIEDIQRERNVSGESHESECLIGEAGPTSLDEDEREPNKLGMQCFPTNCDELGIQGFEVGMVLIRSMTIAKQSVSYIFEV